MSSYVYLDYFSMKIICYKLKKHKALKLYEKGEKYLSYLSLKILYLNIYTINLYLSRDSYTNCLFPKIVCHKLHLCEAFLLYVTEDGYSNSISLQMLCYKLQKYKAFTCICLQMIFHFTFVKNPLLMYHKYKVFLQNVS